MKKEVFNNHTDEAYFNITTKIIDREIKSLSKEYTRIVKSANGIMSKNQELCSALDLIKENMKILEKDKSNLIEYKKLGL